MEIETVDDLVEKLADWIGVYGGCKNNEEDINCENKCGFDSKKPFCCRNGFSSEMENRIRSAVANDELLDKFLTVDHKSEDAISIQYIIKRFTLLSEERKTLNTAISDYYTPLLTEAGNNKNKLRFDQLLSEIPDSPFLLSAYRMAELYGV